MNTMTSRERVIAAINHRESDRIPLDLGTSGVSGIHHSTLWRLRKVLGLEERIITVPDPAMMLGEVDEDVRQALGIDVVGLATPNSPFGYRNDSWKPWTMPDGTRVNVAAGFSTTVGDDGVVYAYPLGGDTTKAPSLKMPAGGFFFDNILRQRDLDGHTFDARTDYAGDFGVLDESACCRLDRESKQLFDGTSYAIFGTLFPGCLGDFFQLGGAWLDNPPGIRSIEEWMVAHHERPAYVKDCFAMQTDVGLRNLELYRQAVGERVQVIAINATDFGTQHGPLVSPDVYREFYRGFHRQLNDWVHKNTGWKTFCHSCGCVEPFIEDFIDAGFDILNPIQVSSANMDPAALKAKYGDRLVFWGGAADPQRTVPFGTPEAVREETAKNVAILGKGGGYVCANVHNIQANTPPENIVALFDTARNVRFF